MIGFVQGRIYNLQITRVDMQDNLTVAVVNGDMICYILKGVIGGYLIGRLRAVMISLPA